MEKQYGEMTTRDKLGDPQPGSARGRNMEAYFRKLTLMTVRDNLIEKGQQEYLTRRIKALADIEQRLHNYNKQYNTGLKIGGIDEERRYLQEDFC